MCIFILSSCSGGGNAPEIKKLLQDKDIERVTITNSGYAGRYTIKDKKSMDRFKGYIEKAKVVSKNPELEPDFLFELYDGENSVGTFKYIAGITDSDTANLIDMDGRLYSISRNIEDIFMKRLMKRNNLKNIPEYYVSLIGTIIDKQEIKAGSKVVADIGGDHSVTKSITSVEQKSILDSIGRKNIEVTFPIEGKEFDYKIAIKTGKYNSTSSEAIVTVTETESGKATKYDVSGNYKNGDWEFHIKFR